MIKFIKIAIAAIIIIPFLILSYVPIFISFLFRKAGNEKASRFIIDKTAHFLIRLIFLLLGGKVVLEGSENIPSEGRICFIANHTSLLDCIAVMYPKNVFTGFIGKVEVKKIPIVSNWFSVLNSVYIDRKSPRDSIKAILQGSENIKGGLPMTIFPEGTRSKDGRVHEFKAGSFKMATRVDAIICPCVIKGTRYLFETPFSLLRKKVYITFLPPIDTSKLSEEEKKEIHIIVENSIRECYEKLPEVKKNK